MEALPLFMSSLVTSSHASEKIHTTLYDLVAALSAETEPHEDDVVTAALLHILHTKRVRCMGAFTGYRLTCEETHQPAPATAPAMEQALAI